MTFSLIARCPQSGMFGVAITSSSPAVAARCAHVCAGIGAVASQNITDPILGARALALMAEGANAEEAVAILARNGNQMAYRQLLAVDGNGQTAIFSGVNTLGVWAEAKADNAASAGNLLANKDVIAAVLDSFLSASGHFGDRLLAGLQGGLSAGGEAGPLHSAGMRIVHETAWDYADLRCDWTMDCPIQAVKVAWEVYKPQADDYIQRALQPAAAPRYGVAGDEK